MRRHTEAKARDLKPCPFCGAAAAVDRDKHGVIRSVDCSATCDLHHPAGVDWNTRPIEDALRARAEAAEQRAEAWRWFAQEVASDVHPIGADPLGDITTDFLPVLLDITRRAAQQQGADCARAEAAERRAEALAAALAQARAEGEAAGAARERAAVVAYLRREPWGPFDEADRIEAGEHVGAAGGAR